MNTDNSIHFFEKLARSYRYVSRSFTSYLNTIGNNRKHNDTMVFKSLRSIPQFFHTMDAIVEKESENLRISLLNEKRATWNYAYKKFRINGNDNECLTEGCFLLFYPGPHIISIGITECKSIPIKEIEESLKNKVFAFTDPPYINTEFWGYLWYDLSDKAMDKLDKALTLEEQEYIFKCYLEEVITSVRAIPQYKEIPKYRDLSKYKEVPKYREAPKYKTLQKCKTIILAIGNAGGNVVENIYKETKHSKLMSARCIFADCTESDLRIHDPDGYYSILLELEEDFFPTDIFDGVEMLVIVAGLGGRTGTKFTELAVKAAKDTGVASVTVVCIIPFAFEGQKRNERAEVAAKRLSDVKSVKVIVFNNETLISEYSNINFFNALSIADEKIIQNLESVI